MFTGIRNKGFCAAAAGHIQTQTHFLYMEHVQKAAEPRGHSAGRAEPTENLLGGLELQLCPEKQQLPHVVDTGDRHRGKGADSEVWV